MKLKLYTLIVHKFYDLFKLKITHLITSFYRSVPRTIYNQEEANRVVAYITNNNNYISYSALTIFDYAGVICSKGKDYLSTIHFQSHLNVIV